MKLYFNFTFSERVPFYVLLNPWMKNKIISFWFYVLLAEFIHMKMVQFGHFSVWREHGVSFSHMKWLPLSLIESLCDVLDETLQWLYNTRSWPRNVDVISNCVKIIHSLSLVNLDFVILEYGNGLPAWFLRNEKLHTPSRTVLCVCERFFRMVSTILEVVKQVSQFAWSDYSELVFKDSLQL